MSTRQSVSSASCQPLQPSSKQDIKKIKMSNKKEFRLAVTCLLMVLPDIVESLQDCNLRVFALYKHLEDHVILGQRRKGVTK